MSYTPGEWVLQPNGAAYNVRRLDQPHHMILLNMKHIPQEEFEANANLIVSAPEMLRVLNFVSDYFANLDNMENEEKVKEFVKTAVEDVIAKAEGRNV